MEIFVLKPLVVEKSSLFSGTRNDALMHREDFDLIYFGKQYM